ncbi:MAG: DUF1800 domain-containing protein [Bacteroidota bacterium]
MDRRSFLGSSLQRLKVADPTPTDPIKRGEIDPVDKLVNQELPSVARVSAGLEPYTGEWGWWQARHLLSRTLFGPKKAEIAKAVEDGLESTIDLLVADWQEPAAPLNSYFEKDANVAIGETWVEFPLNNEDGVFLDGYRRTSLRNWSVGLMIDQGVSLREKMTLFWFNHFATESLVVFDQRRMYELVRLFRQYALGDFKTLVEEVTVSSAMLNYLNGDQNKVGSPNENYGRELFELFTIGKGPQIGEGNYTNYTEDDVREASKVLTGWTHNFYGKTAGRPAGEYKDNRHDKSTKNFSAAFDFQTIENAGEEEYKLLIDMIFGKVETARYICRKLYRWFCYYVIDEATEQFVIEPMAQLLVANNYNIKPVIRALISSAHFFDNENIGAMIKSPIDYVLALPRVTEAEMPGLENVTYQYSLWNFYFSESAKMEQSLLDPPSVAGWNAYYQEPAFYQIWISSPTLSNRQFYSDIVSRENGKKISDDIFLTVDVFKFLNKVSDASDPNVLVSEWTELLLPVSMPESQRTMLKDVLIPGLPDFEWTEEYVLYITDPSDEEVKKAVESKLRALLQAIISLPEFHLM